MIIMTYAAARATGDGNLAFKYVGLFSRDETYVVAGANDILIRSSMIFSRLGRTTWSTQRFTLLRLSMYPHQTQNMRQLLIVPDHGF